MRLGGAPGGGDPLAMGAGNDYAELCDLGPSRWSSRSGYQQVSPPVNSIYHHTGGSIAGVGVGGVGVVGGGPSAGGVVGSTGGTTLSSSGGATIRSNSFEAEDVIGPYGTSSARIGNSTSSLRGRSGTVPNSTRHNGKKRPISPEQVIRLFNTQSSSSSVPTSYHSNGTRDRGRRSPASSPPSTTHQIYRDRDRDRSIPNIHQLTTRTVNMSRDQQTDASHGFGICVKGGKDSGVGVYISRIEEGSVAERAGLRPGDTILEVNGTPFTAINHEEALKRCVQILKSSRQISMTVRAPPSAGASMINSTAPLHGFGPPPSVVGSTSRLAAAVADPLGGAGLAGVPAGSVVGGGAPVGVYPPPPNRQTCSWMDRQGRPASPPYEYGGRRPERRDRVRRVELVIEPGQSLGLMIRGGVEYGLGIFITGVDKDSVADRAGLMVGDQILEVNNQSFMDVTHDEAVSQFKFHKRMSLLVRDVGKVPHSCTTVEPEPWDAYSPTGVRTRRKCPVSAMVEEKARSLLPRHHFANLSYYIAEYGARGMTIEAFVSVLLEMLDTPEKHTLVTEIRELIFPEDRTRYDELVYRRGRDVYGDPLDRHRRKDHLPHSHDLPVSDTDLEVIEATGRGLADDPGAVAAAASTATAGNIPDIRNRPPAPLPYRPMSAGPILHHHPPSSSSSSRHLNTSQSHLADLGSGGTPNRVAFGAGLGAPSPPAGVLGLNPLYHPNRHKISSSSSDVVKQLKNKDYNDPSRPRRGSETQLSRADYDSSMQRLPMDQNGSSLEQSQDQPPHIVPDHRGNLHITVKKSKPILGIAIEGGANTKHPLPRIINIHEHGAAYDAGGLEVGQLILEVDGNKVDGMHHQDVARLIAECFAARDKNDITFLVVEAKKSNLEPKPTALIFLEA
ncbi:whirlin [Armigeres subalbatus]|uniref:whirlin n=1 Tax=Armigeres subalbatus TaxID=124917 RepID=UPI002ED3F95C